jgi:hypothetical protein
MFKWLAKRRSARELAERDAEEMIAWFGDGAYFEARLRASHQPGTIDANRPPGHWHRVRRIIGERSGKTVGLSGWDRRLSQ